MGLNAGPLSWKGKSEARIACNLWSRDGVGRYDCQHSRKRFKEHPYFTQCGKDGSYNSYQYIANMKDGAIARFKYFIIKGSKSIKITIRGVDVGEIVISTDPNFLDVFCNIPVDINYKNKIGLIYIVDVKLFMEYTQYILNTLE